jgi:hypothetical protein
MSLVYDFPEMAADLHFGNTLKINTAIYITEILCAVYAFVVVLEAVGRKSAKIQE